MSAIICKTNHAPLDTLHKIIQDLQKLNDLQPKLCYASIPHLPESETTSELKDSRPKLHHAKIIHPEGTVSRNVKIFQKYIDQRYQNISL